MPVPVPDPDPEGHASMLNVCASHRLERLADRLVSSLGVAEGGRAQTAAGFFARPPIVVPNKPMARYLRYELARRTGIAAGVEFHGVEDFLEILLSGKHLVPSGSPSRRPYKLVGRAALRSLFLDILDMDEDDPAAGVPPLPESVRGYLDAAGPAGRELRRFQLATHMARLAGQYGDTRPALLRAWAEGDPGPGDGALAETEGWQRALWARVIGPGGALDRVRARGACEWSLVLPMEMFAVLQESGGYHPPSEVHFFGFSYASTGLRTLLEHLAATSEVHVYVPSPWKWVAEPDPEEPSAFRAWAQPGVDFAKLFWGTEGAAANCDFDEPRAGTPTALGQLHRDILEAAGERERERERERRAAYEADGSIRVLACPGIRREAEVIAGEIWRLVREDETGQGPRRRPPGSPERLRFHHFTVLIADAKNRGAYQAHLRAAFEEVYGIPYNMIDLPLAGESRAIEAVLLLLAVPLGSFTRPELLPLLTHPAVAGRFPDGADAGRWRRWCEQLEIVHGADRSDHAETYIDREVFHWEQGLRRLVLGTFLTGPRCGGERGFLLDGADLLPHDEPVEAQADAARLLLLVRSLVADARFARSARMPLSDWSDFLARMISAYLAPDPDVDADRRALAGCLAAVHALKQHDLGGGRVGYRVACEIVREAVAGLTTEKGHCLADGVSIAPLEAMRAVPFRVTFLCGLGEGLFPSAEGPDPLDVDLALSDPSRGAITPRQRDQYLFLETLSCTRDRLSLSYVSRDAQTGDELEPSPLVHELLRHLDPACPPLKLNRWVKPCPLRRYEEIDERKGPVVAAAAHREARAKALRSRLLTHCGGELELTPARIWALDSALCQWLKLGPPHDSSLRAKRVPTFAVSLHQVRQFLLCPLQGWARVMLRLREDEGDGDGDDPATREDEPFVTSRLAATSLLRAVFLEALQAGVLDRDLTGDRGWAALAPFYERRAGALARAGGMPAGIFREAESRRHRACLGAWAAAFHERGLLAHAPFQIHRFGRASESERACALGPTISLDVPIPGADGTSETIRVALHGRTEILARGLPGSLTCVNRADVQHKDFLAGFLGALALSLIDKSAWPEYQVHILCTGEDTGKGKGKGKGKAEARQRRLRGIDPARARAYLTGVLGEMLGRTHAYLLPCEAAFAFLTKQTPVAVTVEDIVESGRSCSSQYGPVPDFHLYEPPDEDAARAMIETRFGLFRDCGGLGE